MMKDTCAVSAMVTYLSWMADVRTSFFIVRILIGNRNGSTLRSVGSNNMFPPVLCLGQEWHVVCQRVRRGLSVPVVGNSGYGIFWVFWLLFCVLCAWRVLGYPPFCTQDLGFLGVPPAGTRLLDVVQWEHYLWNHWRECQAAHKIAFHYLLGDVFIKGKPYMLALAGRPSLHGNYACMVYWTKGAPRGNCRQTNGKTSVSPFRVFLFSRNSRKRFWCLVFLAFMDWEGSASWAFF